MRTAFWIAWTVVLVAKVLLAATLAPFGDEAWYWQESRALDWAFSDLPPATALLIRLGEAAFGHGVFAMRAAFLLLGAVLPWLLLRTSTRLFGPTAGGVTGLLALALPLTATLGIFALPDVPLTLCAAWALNAFERATRNRRWREFIELGLALAIACLSHYRAAMLLAAGLVFLCVSPRGRKLWREPGLWFALAIAASGLIPLLLFNAEHAWTGLRFQFVERHPWSFHADALVQPLEQAIVCTPLFYGLLLWGAWQCVRRARTGAPWDLLAVSAIVPLVAYTVLGCFADDTRLRLHWPLPGYLPLLIALPALWPRRLDQGVETPLPATRTRTAASRAWHAFAAAALAFVALGCAATFAYFALAAVPGSASVLGRVKAFPEHLVGWREVAAQTQALLAQPRYADAVLVADNFMLAAELDFALDGARVVYALDHPINTKHGRSPQLASWGRDEAGLRTRHAQRVLLVAEPTARRERERAAWLATLCTRVADLEPVAQLELYGGRKRYGFFAGRVADADTAAAPCHTPELDGLPIR